MSRTIEGTEAQFIGFGYEPNGNYILLVRYERNDGVSWADDQDIEYEVTADGSGDFVEAVTFPLPGVGEDTRIKWWRFGL